MDPDQALADARQAVKDFDVAHGPEQVSEAAERLANAFAALDEWMSRGGFAPAAWRKS